MIWFLEVQVLDTEEGLRPVVQLVFEDDENYASLLLPASTAFDVHEALTEALDYFPKALDAAYAVKRGEA